MLNEIDKDFYCSAGCYGQTGVCLFNNCKYQCENLRGICGAFHRKHPTPEQFKEEYGEEYPDNGAVYVYDDNGFDDNGNKGFWNILDLDTLRQEAGRYINNKIVICACTPWSCPPKDYKPEV